MGTEPNEAKPDSVKALMGLDPQALLESAVEHNAEIETMDRLVGLANDVMARKASEAWHRAMSEFQGKCPPIKKTATGRNTTSRGSDYNYGYAKLGEITSIITAVMGPLGLSISYRMKHEEQKVIASCRISHEYGHHEESGEVGVPVISDDSGSNPMQMVGVAHSYAKRYALLAIIGLAPIDADEEERSLTTRVSKRRGRQAPSDPINDLQVKRLWTIADATARKHNATKEDAIGLVRRILQQKGYESTNKIKVLHYDEICQSIERWGKKR